jgi:hypothetical protein
MNKLKYIIAVYILFAGLLPAQSRTNLEVFYSLIDSSISLLPDINAKTGSVYTGNNAMLYNYVVQKLKARYNGFEVSGKEFEISYALEKIKLEYGEIFRKRFLGDYFIERNFLVEGTAVADGSSSVNSFSIAFSDTAALDDLGLLENDLHPFTKASVPAEPLLAGIIEPVVAIGAAAAAVVLFFIVRSK